MTAPPIPRRRRFSCPIPVLAAALLAGCGGSGSGEAVRTVRVGRGSVQRVAMAVGKVVPEREAAVTSTAGGLVTALHVKLGQRVAEGDLLAEVRPAPTDRALIEAERAVQAAREGEEAAGEFVAGEHLAAWMLRAVQGDDNLERMRRGAERAREAAEQRLRLLEEGVVEIDGRRIDFNVRAPIAGQVLDLPVRIGSPIVPSSIYGTGTVLMTLGDLDRAVFRGTVDEIEVGRLQVGMPVTVRIGALPEREFHGELVEIGLRGEARGESVVFPVEIALDRSADPDAAPLRSGYSAVAEIVLERASDALVVPERLVEYRDGKAFVQEVVSPAPELLTVEREVEVGVSDGLEVEILGGIDEGVELAERTWGRR